MSKYDKERQSLGVMAVGSASPMGSSNSKYASERQELFNPTPTKFTMDEMNKEKISMIRQDSNRIPALNMPKVDVNASYVQNEAPIVKSDPLYKKILREVVPETTDILKMTPLNPLVTVGETLNKVGLMPKPANQVLRGIESGATFGASELQNKILGRTEAVDDARSQLGQYGQIAGSLLPGAAIERVAAKALKPVIQNLPKVAKFGITGAIAGGVDATGQEVGDVAFRDSTFDPMSVAIGVGAGGILGGASPYIGAGINKLLSVFRKPAQEAVQAGPMLALPEPKPRGNVNTVQTEDVINIPEAGPRALPEPDITPPTTARLSRQANPMREKLEAFARSMEGAQLPPGREREVFIEAWGRFAGPNDPSLETAIDLAYSSKPSRLSSDLVQKARETQHAREVSGVGMPVKSMPDRYQGGVFANVESPIPTAGRRANATSANRIQQAADKLRNVQPQQSKVIDVPFKRVDEVSVPRRTETPVQRPQQRGFINTLSNSENISDEVRQGLEQSSAARYEPITNQGTVDAANKRIAEDINAAEAFVLRGVKSDAEQIATGMRLIQELQSAGQTERAVTIAEKLAEKLTKAGQTVQAASIWNRLTPEGALVAAQRKVAEINKEATRLQRPLEVTPKNADDIMTAAGAIQRAGASQERAAQVMDIADRLKKGEMITTDEQNTLNEFVKDLQSFTKPKQAPRQPRMPKEMNEPRVRDKVVSFLDEQEKAARERLKARGIQVSSTPLDVWGDYAIIGASKLAKGSVKFVDWSEQMVREFGNEIRPHLANIYERAQEILTQNSKQISQKAISRAETIAESYLRKNEARLKPDDVEFIRKMAQNVSELSGDMQRQASQELQAIMNSFERAGIGRKISSVQYISMLLNPVTQIRNIVGNELMYRLERMNRLLATPVDMISSGISGKPRQITFKSGPSVWDDFFTTSSDYIKGLGIGTKAGWRGLNPDGLTTAYDISGQAFRSKLNPLTYMEKTLGAVMKGFDYASYNRTVNQRLREMAYLDALNNGVKGNANIRNHMGKYLANLDDNIASIAKEYGKYITLQDDTMLSNTLQGARRGLNKLSTGGLTTNFGAGSIVMPFAKTPANLLMRAFEYSPAGFGRSIFQASQIIMKRNTDLTSADVIQGVTRAILGSGLTGIGWWLADKGVLKGDSPTDKDVRNLEKQSGLAQFQLNGSALQRMLSALVTGNMKDVDEAAKIRPGDVLWQYEWAQPSSIPLAIGANVSQDLKKEKPLGLIGLSGSAAFGGLNTLFNTSLLQGLQEAFDFPPGEDNKVRAFLLNLSKSAPSMFTPSILNRMNQYMDNAQRESYSTDLGEYMKNSVKAKVPGLAQTLPQRVDTLGQPMTRENNFFDVFVSPAQRSIYKPSESAKLVMDLLSETGDDRVAPRTVPRYITGTDPLTRQQKKINLTPEQYTKYQKIVGEETARLLDRIPPNVSTERKIQRVLDALTKAGEKGRKEMRREFGLR